MLKANSRLKKLILSSNLLDDDAVRILADGISVHESLQTLVGLERIFVRLSSGFCQQCSCSQRVHSYPRSLLRPTRLPTAALTT
jgi:hypothetical protein